MFGIVPGAAANAQSLHCGSPRVWLQSSRRKVTSLGYDAFQFQFAGMHENRLAIAVQSFKGMLPVILPVQFEQVESIQENPVVMGIRMQLVEIRLAVLPSPNRFPVQDDGPDPKG
jgi:hypothetical protein